MVNPLVGIKLEIEGEEHLDPKNGPAVIVGNHQSFIDILYLGRMFPKKASIMAKKELAWTPFLGWWSACRSSPFPLPFSPLLHPLCSVRLVQRS
jgi:1-acyl-sn-glycerol-3-phosphate acyltransferase